MSVEVMNPVSALPEKKRKFEETSEHTQAILLSPPPPPVTVSGLRIKRLSEKARLPTRGSAFAAGYGLYRFDSPQLTLAFES